LKVPYLPKARIERAAVRLLVAHAKECSKPLEPPVAAEEVLECHLGLSLEFADLQGQSGDREVLGATWVDAGEVAIDASLDPVENPGNEGRYQFTVAHECGHWTLHRQQLLDATCAPLFDDRSAPSIVCRASQQHEPVEWQANYFAACLLMPEELVREQWKDLRGGCEAYLAADEISDLAGRYGIGETDGPTVEVARQMAERFNVSGQAMQIRLAELGLIITQKQGPTLFD
jgi:hypothetical protein